MQLIHTPGLRRRVLKGEDAGTYDTWQEGDWSLGGGGGLQKTLLIETMIRPPDCGHMGAFRRHAADYAGN